MEPEWVAWRLLAGLLVQALVIAFHLGRHAARLSMVEKACQDAGASAAVLAALTATVHALKEQVGALDHTIRNMLMQRVGRGRPPEQP